jgi:hypothetical protein
MSDVSPIALAGLFLGWGMVNLILSSRLAEYRIDSASIDGGMNNDLTSIRRRFTSANYSQAGQRLLLWLKLSTIVQFVVFLGWIFFFPPD